MDKNLEVCWKPEEVKRDDWKRTPDFIITSSHHRCSPLFTAITAIGIELLEQHRSHHCTTTAPPLIPCPISPQHVDMTISHILIALLTLTLHCSHVHCSLIRPLAHSPVTLSAIARGRNRVSANHVDIMKRQPRAATSGRNNNPMSSSPAITATTAGTKKSTLLRNVPNMLSLFRLAAIPVFILSFLTHSKGLATGIFVVSSLTDFLDGYIARRFNLTSEFGAFIDPVADKVTSYLNSEPTYPNIYLIYTVHHYLYFMLCVTFSAASGDQLAATAVQSSHTLDCVTCHCNYPSRDFGFCSPRMACWSQPPSLSES